MCLASTSPPESPARRVTAGVITKVASTPRRVRLSEEARKGRANLKVLFTTAYARNAIVHDGRLDPELNFCPTRSPTRHSVRSCAT